MAQWIGYMVSIKCADNKGTYQGEIISATSHTITLSKAFCDGIPCESNQVTVLAEDIADLKLIDKQSNQTENSTITIAKPIAKRAGRTQSTSESCSSNKVNLNGSQHSKSKPIDIECKPNSHDVHFHKNGTPNKRDKSKGKWNKSWKDEACFGSPLDSTISKDFDFEKNLALFNKQAVWEEINSLQKPDIVKHADQSRKQQKYRHDENVIATIPTTYRQIILPKQDFYEYTTDDGLIIPSISRSLRNKLWAIAEKEGLTWERQVELMGRAAAEISLQLLGGGHRINPRNMHQLPTVVVLCGPHRQGTMGINTARQLASHGILTVVYLENPKHADIKQELALYKLTKNKVVTSVSALPQNCDLIIASLCEDDNPKINPDLSEWACNNRAPLLALDPPPKGIPGIQTKYSLLPVLPLPHSADNGKLYLCNLGFPIEIFSEVGIKYRSPFGAKFVIPLHPNEEP